MRILKADEERHRLTGIVYQIGHVDSQGDQIEDSMAGLQTLQHAAWRFMEKYARGESRFNIDHSGEKLEDVVLIESFVTDCEMEKSGQTIPPGAWVITLQVPEELWPRVKNCRGFSMQGQGKGREVNV